MGSCPHYNLLPWAHIPSLEDYSDHPLVDKLRKKLDTDRGCLLCGKKTQSSWLCLNPNCFYLGCGRTEKQHAMNHYRTTHNMGEDRQHCVFLDVVSCQCWCYECDEMLSPNLTEILHRLRRDTTERESQYGGNNDIFDDAATISSGSLRGKPFGGAIPTAAVGLYNLGNSCYMNAAIQAFINCPSITGFFTRCSAFVYRHRPRYRYINGVPLHTFPHSGHHNHHHYHSQQHYNIYNGSSEQSHGHSNNTNNSDDYHQQHRASYYINHEVVQRRIAESFHRLVETITSSSGGMAISPSRLVREVKMLNPMFHGYTQQDTMDFLRCVLERLHEELAYLPSHCTDQQLVFEVKGEDGKSATTPSAIAASSASPQKRRSERLAKLGEDKGGVPSINNNNQSQSSSSSSSSKNIPPPRCQSIINDTFGGVLRSEIHCQECNNVSVKDDLFYDVSVQICSSPDGSKPAKSSSYLGNIFSSLGETIGLNSKPVKLETCLAAFCAPETLEGKDRYRCEKCNRLVKSKKSLKFKELPSVLILQMKRFRHDSYFSSKINNHVVFPMDNLDLTPYLHEVATKEGGTETRYYLSAIISHRGTFGGGHYVAYCRHGGTGQWLEFDDSNVRVVGVEEVASIQAYVLFYSLVDWHARREREEWLPSIPQNEKTSLSTEHKEGVYLSRQWLNRWCTIANPGPLDNGELQCPHGEIAPDREIDVCQLVQWAPFSIYANLVASHGECSGLAPLRMARPCARCAEESVALIERRKREEEDIQALDTSSIKSGEHWYLISSEWLLHWGQFKAGEALPPGPICNDLLLIPGGGNVAEQEPRPNLVRGTHYRGVNKRVWDYFVRIYGGGPAIIRKNINIYGPAPSVDSASTEGTIADEVYVDVIGH